MMGQDASITAAKGTQSTFICTVFLLYGNTYGLPDDNHRQMQMGISDITEVSHLCGLNVFSEPGGAFAGIVAIPTLELSIKGPFKPVY